MSERKWTGPQRQAITARGGDLLVSAAAGSGKTAVLTERVLTLITDRTAPVDLDRLLIVTFSNAAAEEMRQRIAGRLSERMEEEPENAALRRQSLLLSSAEICTIHAFCHRLIRENFHLLGLPGDLTLGQEGEMALLQASVLEQLLDEKYEAADPSFMRLIELLSGSRNDKKVASSLLLLYRFLRNHPHYRGWAARHIAADSQTALDKTAWGSILRRYAADTLDCALAALKGCLPAAEGCDTLRDRLLPLLQQDCAMLERLREELESAPWDRCAEQIWQADFPSFPRISDPACATEKNRILVIRRKAAAQLAQLKTRVFLMKEADYRRDQEQLAPLLDALRELVLEFDSRYAAAKLERGRLDFSDLEHYALALLTEPETGRPTTLARRIGSHYAEILLDEYQDTNALQEMIFSALSEGSTRRFMVGDVKQSIYGFREACPENFLSKKDTYPLYDGEHFPARIALSANFRTRREITGFVNRLFASIMTRRTAGMDYLPEDELVSALPFDYSVPRPVTVLALAPPAGTSAAECRRSEAAQVAREIAALLREGGTVEQEGAHRPVRPGDICILMRSAKNRAEYYVDALREQGIPVRSAQRESLLETREVKTVVSYLAVLSNPMLDLELAEVLCSPMYGFTGDDLARLRLAGRRERLYQNLLTEVQGGAAGYAAFLEDYNFLRNRMQELPVSELIGELCEKTDFWEKCRVLPEGERAVANLRLLQAHAADYERGGRADSDFADYLRRLSGRQCELESAAVSGSDAVTVTTVHRAKGLEFPIVFLVGCNDRFRRAGQGENSDIAMDRELGFACKLRDNNTMLQHKTLPLAAMQLQNQKTMVMEEMRILYVALTRAREKLYLAATGPYVQHRLQEFVDRPREAETFFTENAGSYWDWLCGVITQQGPELELRCEQPAPPQPASEQPSGPPPAAPACEEEALARLQNKLGFRYPYDADTVTPRRISVSELAEHRSREPYLLQRRPKCLSRQESTATERGNAAHRTMQFADLPALRADAAAEVERLVGEGYLYREEGSLVDFEAIGTLLQSPLGERLLAADCVYREMRFLQEFTPEELQRIDGSLVIPGRTLLMGAVDAVLVEGERAVIVDYKTDRISAPQELLERYTLQLRLYAAMVERQLGLPVSEVLLYSFCLGQVVPVGL